MKCFGLLVILTLAWQVAEIGATGQSNDSERAQMQAKVGMVTRNFTDQHRKNWEGTESRPLKTAIWYPAAATAIRSETIFGGPPDTEVFAPVTVAADAEISLESQKYPSYSPVSWNRRVGNTNDVARILSGFTRVYSGGGQSSR
jgi:hypothetical protein